MPESDNDSGAARVIELVLQNDKTFRVRKVFLIQNTLTKYLAFFVLLVQEDRYSVARVFSKRENSKKSLESTKLS